MDLMVTTNQKPIIDAQMKKRKESKHNTKDITKCKRKTAKEEGKNKNEPLHNLTKQLLKNRQ